jgi:hypothetical protein
VDSHFDKLNNWEQGLLRFAFDLIDRPSPCVEDLTRAMAIINTVRDHLG